MIACVSADVTVLGLVGGAPAQGWGGDTARRRVSYTSTGRRDHHASIPGKPFAYWAATDECVSS